MGDVNSNGVLQVVSGEGGFNTEGLQAFVRDSGVEGSGVGYTIVAITGPQSSGKSTLLNHLVRLAGGGSRCRRRPALCPHAVCLPSPSADAVRTASLQFGTRFEEMDALSGRHQTTRGIWLARATKVCMGLERNI